MEYLYNGLYLDKKWGNNAFSYEKRNNIKNGFYHLNQIAFAYNSILY